MLVSLKDKFFFKNLIVQYLCDYAVLKPRVTLYSQLTVNDIFCRLDELFYDVAKTCLEKPVVKAPKGNRQVEYTFRGIHSLREQNSFLQLPWQRLSRFLTVNCFIDAGMQKKRNKQI